MHSVPSLAKETGLTRQRIYQILNELNVDKDSKDHFIITDQVVKDVKQKIEKSNDKSSKVSSSKIDSLTIKNLRSQIDSQNRQLADKNKQLEYLKSKFDKTQDQLTMALSSQHDAEERVKRLEAKIVEPALQSPSDKNNNSDTIIEPEQPENAPEDAEKNNVGNDINTSVTPVKDSNNATAENDNKTKKSWLAKLFGKH